VQFAEEEDDTVRIYRLCGDCEPKIEILGQGRRSTDRCDIQEVSALKRAAPHRPRVKPWAGKG
jgi:CRISPR/Cas system-associated endoribonuclease Cas2